MKFQNTATYKQFQKYDNVQKTNNCLKNLRYVQIMTVKIRFSIFNNIKICALQQSGFRHLYYCFIFMGKHIDTYTTEFFYYLK